jgi:C1A family cysteine protease
MIRTRTRTASRYLVSNLIILILLLASALAYADQKELDEIRSAIKAKGGKWVADETSISKLPPNERKMRLGVDETFGQGAETAASSEEFVTPEANGATLSPTLDWRNVGGVNYVTPIKNQGSCGSCWAFAVTAALESQALMDAGIRLDLSEQVLVSCPNGGGTCSGGSPSTASTYIRDVGLPLESCFPYTATNSACSNACLTYRTDTYRVLGWHSGQNAVDAMKNAVYTYGPVVATFYVYSDFFSYRSGVYSYATGTYQGAHAVLTVGYDDVNQCFIVKNSWGTGWGEAGFFRIAYSEVTGTSRFGYSVLAYDGYPTSICVQANPTLTLSPSAPPAVTPGTPLTYTVSITNNDNSGCASSTFNLSAAVPSGWTGVFGSSALTISAGGSSSTSFKVTSSTTAASGSYPVTVSTTDSAAPVYTASASATASIQAAVCTRANPKVALSPTANWVKAGTAVTYTLSVTNNDNSACPNSSFNLSVTVPDSSWLGTLASPSLTLGPGGSKTTTLSVISPALASDGSYTITAKGTNSIQSTYTAAASAVETLISSLTVKVSTDKSSYKSNQPISIKTTVTANGSSVANASVIFTVTNGGATVATNNVTTDTYGNASFIWAQKSRGAGTYSIKADAAFSGISGSGTATFKVQ